MPIAEVDDEALDEEENGALTLSAPPMPAPLVVIWMGSSLMMDTRLPPEPGPPTAAGSGLANGVRLDVLEGVALAAAAIAEDDSSSTLWFLADDLRVTVVAVVLVWGGVWAIADCRFVLRSDMRVAPSVDDVGVAWAVPVPSTSLGVAAVVVSADASSAASFWADDWRLGRCVFVVVVDDDEDDDDGALFRSQQMNI